MPAITRRTSTSVAVLLSASLGAWVALHAQNSAPSIEPLSSPAGASSSVPQMTVEGDRIVMRWVERDGKKSTLKFAERTATGWSMPAVVISSEKLMVNAADVPSSLKAVASN